MSVHKFEILGVSVEIDDDPSKFTALELGTVERYTGMTMTEFGRKLSDTENLSILCWSALAWIALRRAGKPMPYDEFMDSVGVLDLINALREGGAEMPGVDAPAPNRAARRATKG